ncbi:hypothetical protein CHKEEEPN_0351 [Methylorubrum podarium]|nr:hypothetical protein CHKEEEPN_0351 [Methylorubrum podarium]
MVPGSALKAVVASALGADDPTHPLHEVLGQVVFGHLAPHRKGAARPRAVPLSAYFVGDETAAFDALSDDPVEWASAGVVRFEPDWKSGKALEALNARFHHTFIPRYDARTRTAVAASGVADEKKLFSSAAVVPGDHVWSGTLAQGEATPEAFATLLAALPARIDGFGKTRVTAQAEVTPSPRAHVPAPTGRTCLVLESEALLHAPGEEDGTVPLDRHVADYLAEAILARGGPQVPPESLNVVCYARHRRVGGYLAARYRGQDAGYRPWLLTTAGSVIAFDLPSDANPAIASFLSRGLPLPRALSTRSWRDCPFVPGNGYGAVRLGTGLGGSA